MGRTGDEIVNTFFDAVDHAVLHDHADWELNGVVNSRERRSSPRLGLSFPRRMNPRYPSC
jgi:hypothetical protein